jgi:Flp pilus assembly protein CpaB
MSRIRPPARTSGGRRSSLGAGDTWRDAFADRPAWADGVLLRRVLAGLCALAAVTLFLRGDPAHARSSVVVAARDLPPGHLLAATDLRLASYPPDATPDGAAADPAPLLGAVLTAALRAGEVLTDVRVVGPRLAAAATGRPDARIVPIRLADTAITEILRAGDRVDVVAAGAEDPTPRWYWCRGRRRSRANATPNGSCWWQWTPTGQRSSPRPRYTAHSP